MEFFIFSSSLSENMDYIEAVYFRSRAMSLSVNWQFAVDGVVKRDEGLSA